MYLFLLKLWQMYPNLFAAGVDATADTPYILKRTVSYTLG